MMDILGVLRVAWLPSVRRRELRDDVPAQSATEPTGTGPPAGERSIPEPAPEPPAAPAASESHPEPERSGLPREIVPGLIALADDLTQLTEQPPGAESSVRAVKLLRW